MSRHTITFIAILLTFYVPLSRIDYAHFPYSDGPEHGAAVRALAYNLTSPSDPMLSGVDGGSPRYVPSILVMSLFMRLSGMDVIAILKLFVIIYGALFLFSAALFSSEYFNDPEQAPWSIAALLFLWGIGWTGANAYMFSAILYTSYYPSVVSFSLAFLALYLQMRFLRSERCGYLIGALLLGALCFVNHPLTGVFFFICSALVYLERGGLNKRALTCYVLSILAALCLTVLWPYYNFFASFMTVASGKMQKTIDYSLTHQYLYSKPLLRAGVALAGIPIVIFYFMQRRYLLLRGGFLLFGLIYLVGFYRPISLAERCIFFIICLLQIAVSRLCRELSANTMWASNRNLKKVIYCILVLFLASGVAVQATITFKEFVYPSFSFATDVPFPRYVNPNAIQHELKKYLHDGDVVLSDLYSSWSVPVYTGAKIVALFHTAPHVRDNIQRIADIETFYNGSTPNSVRNEIIKKYGVTHIFLNFKIDGKQLEPILRETGYSRIVCTERFCVFSVPK